MMLFAHGDDNAFVAQAQRRRNPSDTAPMIIASVCAGNLVSGATGAMGGATGDSVYRVSEMMKPKARHANLAPPAVFNSTA